MEGVERREYWGDMVGKIKISENVELHFKTNAKFDDGKSYFVVSKYITYGKGFYARGGALVVPMEKLTDFRDLVDKIVDDVLGQTLFKEE